MRFIKNFEGGECVLGTNFRLFYNVAKSGSNSGIVGRSWGPYLANHFVCGAFNLNQSELNVFRGRVVEKLHNWWQQLNNVSQNNGFRHSWTKKTRKWLIPQKDWQVLAWGFVPFIPVLPTVVIIIAGLRELKHGFLVLILGNLFRNIIFCYAIYEGHNLFLRFFY